MGLTVEAKIGFVSRKPAARAKVRAMRMGTEGLSTGTTPEYLTRALEKSRRGLGAWIRGQGRSGGKGIATACGVPMKREKFSFWIWRRGSTIPGKSTDRQKQHEVNFRRIAMAEAVVQPEASAPPLNQVQRVVDAFVAPSKTFIDIRRDASWWMPYLIGVVITLILGVVVQQKIGWDKTYQNMLKQSPAQQARIEQAPADQQARAMQMGANITKYSFWATPLIALIAAIVAAAVLMATVNFGFGGKAKFGQMIAVWMYATLPWAIQGILGTISTYFVDPDTFNLKNFVGTNIGYYLPQDLPKTVIALGSAIDIFTIWALVLLTIGCTIVGNIKKGQAAAAVWGWWVIMTILKVVGAMFS